LPTLAEDVVYEAPYYADFGQGRQQRRPVAGGISEVGEDRLGGLAVGHALIRRKIEMSWSTPTDTRRNVRGSVTPT